MKNSFWNQLLRYFYIRKRKEEEPHNINMFLMHGMNRISILLFLVALVILIIRALR